MGVIVTDARRLSPQAQEDLRRRVVAAVEAGGSQVEVAGMFGVSTRSVSRWVNTFRRKGNRGLVAGRRGRRAGEQKALQPRQQARLRRAVLGKFPDQVALPGLVWTRGQVAQLVERWFGLRLSRVTIGKYLRSWGLSPQKPVRKAYEQDPVAVARWLQVEYPKVVAQAKAEGGVILWLDQVGLRSDAPVGATWAPVGATPVVPKTGRRFGVNAMMAMGNRGELYFTVFDTTFTGPVFQAFLDRLVRHVARKIHLIVDGHPVHRRASIRDWLAERPDKIQMHFLPGYSPELNPVELLNGQVKRHVANNTRPASPAHMATQTRNHLHSWANHPDKLIALFSKEEVCYAAA